MVQSRFYIRHRCILLQSYEINRCTVGAIAHCLVLTVTIDFQVDDNVRLLDYALWKFLEDTADCKVIVKETL